jgi:prevent-host-death family protein
METFTIRDLRERTGDLVRNAENGQLSIVAKHGHPLFVALPLDRHALTAGVNAALACRLFADHVLSLAKAARFAGLSNEDFIARLGAMGIPAVDYPARELDDELNVLSA